jgi:hypothetical protein
MEERPADNTEPLQLGNGWNEQPVFCFSDRYIIRSQSDIQNTVDYKEDAN